MESDINILESFIRNHTEEAVSLLEETDFDQFVDIISKLPDDLAAEVLSTMDRFKASRAITSTESPLAAKILGKCTPEAAANIVRVLDTSISEKIFSGMDALKLSSIRRILQFPDGNHFFLHN